MGKQRQKQKVTRSQLLLGGSFLFSGTGRTGKDTIHATDPLSAAMKLIRHTGQIAACAAERINIEMRYGIPNRNAQSANDSQPAAWN
jgi:hypothetical protein